MGRISPQVEMGDFGNGGLTVTTADAVPNNPSIGIWDPLEIPLEDRIEGFGPELGCGALVCPELPPDPVKHISCVVLTVDCFMPPVVGSVGVFSNQLGDELDVNRQYVAGHLARYEASAVVCLYLIPDHNLP